MTTTEDRARTARGLRGALAASVAVLVALGSHVVGGGSVPSWPGVVVPWALSIMVCTLLAGRRLSTIRLALSVATSQLLFHTLFVLGTATPTAGGATSGHHHGAPETLSLAAPSAHTVHMVHADPTMWAWHGVAAAVTTAVLHRGEVMLHRLRELADRTVAWMLGRWVTLLRPAGAVTPRRPATITRTFRPAVPGQHLTSLRRRGPPVTIAV